MIRNVTGYRTLKLQSNQEDKIYNKLCRIYVSWINIKTFRYETNFSTMLCFGDHISPIFYAPNFLFVWDVQMKTKIPSNGDRRPTMRPWYMGIKFCIQWDASVGLFRYTHYLTTVPINTCYLLVLNINSIKIYENGFSIVYDRFPWRWLDAQFYEFSPCVTVCLRVF